MGVDKAALFWELQTKEPLIDTLNIFHLAEEATFNTPDLRALVLDSLRIALCVSCYWKMFY